MSKPLSCYSITFLRPLWRALECDGKLVLLEAVYSRQGGNSEWFVATLFSRLKTILRDLPTQAMILPIIMNEPRFSPDSIHAFKPFLNGKVIVGAY